MAKLKITIQPLSLVFLFLLIYFGWIDEILFYIVALVCHEYSHYFVAKKLGYSLNDLQFSPFGAVLNGSKNYFKPKEEVVIALAGPLVNLALCLLTVATWWILPQTYIITYNFALANISLFICNMLPLFPLDAGRIVLAFIKNNKNFKIIYKLYKINSIIVSIILIILFIISAFSKINISLVLIAIFLISSLFDIKNSLFYQYAYIDKVEEDFKKILPVKEYVVHKDIQLYKILKLINKNSFSVFNFVDSNGKIVKTLKENEVLTLMQSTYGETVWKKLEQKE